MHPSINVLGTFLRPCSHQPLTGWFRDGCCNTDDQDHGLHTVAAVLTDDFLACLQELGNDLVTPAPAFGFPGLKAGDRWCVCAGSWYSAMRRGRACPVDLEATHHATLSVVPLEALMAYAAGHEA